MVAVEVRPAPGGSEEQWQCIVTTPRGRAFYVVHTGDRPSNEDVQSWWDSNRENFVPFYG